MNGTHQILAYTGDINLIVDDIRTIERNSDVLLNACKDIGLAVNTRKTKYMEIGHQAGLMAYKHIRIGSNWFKCCFFFFFWTKVFKFKTLLSKL